MRCASTNHPPTTYEAEMAAMNRARTRLFRRLRDAGHDPADALAVVNAAAVCPTCAGARTAAKPGDRGECFACNRSWSIPLFSAAERRALAASDKVEDQLEPGGVLARLDRAAIRPDPRLATTARLPAVRS